MSSGSSPPSSCDQHHKVWGARGPPAPCGHPLGAPSMGNGGKIEEKGKDAGSQPCSKARVPAPSSGPPCPRPPPAGSAPPPAAQRGHPKKDGVRQVIKGFFLLLVFAGTLGKAQPRDPHQEASSLPASPSATCCCRPSPAARPPRSAPAGAAPGPSAAGAAGTAPRWSCARTHPEDVARHRGAQPPQGTPCVPPHLWGQTGPSPPGGAAGRLSCRPGTR